LSSLFLNHTQRFVQIAFNHSTTEVARILPQIPYDPRILIEAGTPYIKREGMDGVRFIRRLWRGPIVADMKVTDGAQEEVQFAAMAGANAITALGSSPTETLDIFNAICKQHNVLSMIDLINVDNPLKKLMPLRNQPDAVVIHKGRDEEANPRSLIRFKDINKIRSKFDVFVSVGGGLTPEKVRAAYFNGAEIAILNIVKPGEKFGGILENSNFRIVVPHILNEIGM
jgi:bifunctional enzyme Fae/Hps